MISLLMVSVYLNVGLPLGLTPSTSMSSTVLVVWLSYLRLTCPYQRSCFCIRRVVISCHSPDLVIYFYFFSQANALNPPQLPLLTSVLLLFPVVRKPRLFEQIELENLAKISDLPAPNAFEETIRWTKQGILWKFPVDNEQGSVKSSPGQCAIGSLEGLYWPVLKPGLTLY